MKQFDPESINLNLTDLKMWMLTITMPFFPQPPTMQEDQPGYPNQMRPNGVNFGIGGSKKRSQPLGGAFGNLSTIPYNSFLQHRKDLFASFWLPTLPR